MTVKELINKLRYCEDDAEVVFREPIRQKFVSLHNDLEYDKRYDYVGDGPKDVVVLIEKY
jgi:hypothetical protein